MAMTVPPEIVAALTGRPEIGSWEPMFPLLTIDDAGFPHVCMLSRAELEADENYIYAALASQTTVSNVSRRPAATLVVIGDDSAYYAKLAAVHASASVPAAVAFEVTSSVRDSLAIPLMPPRYLVTSSLPVAEAWAQSAQLLSALIDHVGGTRAMGQEPPGQKMVLLTGNWQDPASATAVGNRMRPGAPRWRRTPAASTPASPGPGARASSTASRQPRWRRC